MDHAVQDEARVLVRAGGLVALQATLALLMLSAGVHMPASASPQTSLQSRAEIARELSNPISPLLGIQWQHDLEWRGGPSDDAFRYTSNLQPVFFVALDERWNVVSRSSVSFVYQTRLAGASTSQRGLSNSSESLFLSPRTTRIAGLTWGVGPIVVLPATDSRLGERRIGLGPTAAMIHTIGPVTYGALVQQVWSIGGSNQSYVQPQVAWTMGSVGTTARARSEATYAWNERSWTTPLIVDVAQPFVLGSRAVEISAGTIVYLARPEVAPRWGLRVSVTLVR